MAGHEERTKSCPANYVYSDAQVVTEMLFLPRKLEYLKYHAHTLRFLEYGHKW